jgi:hypothetical protein
VSRDAASALAAELTHLLLAARNPDGGWPYQKGKASRLEPTCAATLALTADSRSHNRLSTSDLAVLEKWPRRGGLLVDASGEVNFGFNGFAGVLLSADPSSRLASELTEALIGARGARLPPATVNRQDDSIQAWPWIEGTFSWVESTAWCLLALKRLTKASHTARAAARIDDGQRLLADRVCRHGGWNYGNSNALGKDLIPYVPTTAVALLSLQDLPRAPHVLQSVSFLESHQQAENGALALSLASICLTVYNRPSADAIAALVADWMRTRFLENLHVMALTLYALTASTHGCEALRV